ncbi:LOW QUALITY PROTEIN: islet cell autoantigen 1-like [Diretmus argenteus]
MLNSGRTLFGEDSSVMARMQKKFWKTKQVLIKATGKKEDEFVVASDADLDSKLEFFRSVQSTCTELLRVIEKYQQRITHLSQEENELGLFLRFQGEHDRTKAGNMMDATSRALCASAKQRLALCPPLHRMQQEVETFRRRAIADTLLTVGHMEKARTEYRGALLWMKDVSQELDPDTYKQLEKFRKVQAQVRGTKSQFEKLNMDVCQKVDMLGASRCNMLSHSLCTYQTTLLQFWEKTAHAMSGIHEAFQGHVPYQFTTLKDLRDPLEQLTEELAQEDKKEKALQSNTDSLVSLDDDKPSEGASAPHEPRGPISSADTDDDLMLMACDLPPPQLQPQLPAHTDLPFHPQLHPPPRAVDPADTFSFGDFQSSLAQLPVAGGDLLSGGPSNASGTGLRPEEEEGEDRERGDMAFLKEFLSPAPGDADEFSREWQDTFGLFEPANLLPTATGATTIDSDVAAARPPSNPPSPTGFLPSQLLDHSHSSTGWSTPPMFQAPPLQQRSGQTQSAQAAPSSTANAAPGGSRDMSAWFNLFADLDPLSNPDAIGRSADELLNA